MKKLLIVVSVFIAVALLPQAAMGQEANPLNFAEETPSEGNIPFAAAANVSLETTIIDRLVDKKVKSLPITRLQTTPTKEFIGEYFQNELLRAVNHFQREKKRLTSEEYDALADNENKVKSVKVKSATVYYDTKSDKLLFVLVQTEPNFSQTLYSLFGLDDTGKIFNLGDLGVFEAGGHTVGLGYQYYHAITTNGFLSQISNQCQNETQFYNIKYTKKLVREQVIPKAFLEIGKFIHPQNIKDIDAK